MKKYIFILFGTVFGFLLSRAGATTYDFYAQLFLFQDLQLLWVIAAAALVGMVGMTLLKRYRSHSWMGALPLFFKGKPYKSDLFPGSLVMGVGWGLAGACPGTALAMLGEGKMGALVTILGIVAGTYFYGLIQSRRSGMIDAEKTDVVSH